MHGLPRMAIRTWHHSCRARSRYRTVFLHFQLSKCSCQHPTCTPTRDSNEPDLSLPYQLLLSINARQQASSARSALSKQYYYDVDALQRRGFNPPGHGGQLNPAKFRRAMAETHLHGTCIVVVGALFTLECRVVSDTDHKAHLSLVVEAECSCLLLFPLFSRYNSTSWGLGVSSAICGVAIRRSVVSCFHFTPRWGMTDDRSCFSRTDACPQLHQPTHVGVYPKRKRTLGHALVWAAWSTTTIAHAWARGQVAVLVHGHRRLREAVSKPPSASL